ncbi:hypothetical protein SEMRO_2417_G326970.1 [Seminavis robusta]|uniref:Uncharacterized protein n=1 Tax=Seminavis robusta TaxID=568900 RepID=A0A9N8EZG5_9STRA|nr:hypothetical protein SEMRO_2417_G326970.1 [Seminavis robusta]|eukprot:Sro2417_g326970.1 n/a (161) ;mRNA; r:9771-10253
MSEANFNTRRMRIAITAASSAIDRKSSFESLSDRDMKKLYTAIEETMKLGQESDVNMMVTLTSNAFISEKDVASIIQSLRDDNLVSRIVEESHDLIVLITDAGNVVTIRFVSWKKFIVQPAKIGTIEEEDDDSFEFEEGLSQQIAPLKHFTPNKGRRNYK